MKASLLILPAAKALSVTSMPWFGSAAGSSAGGLGPGRHRYLTAAPSDPRFVGLADAGVHPPLAHLLGQEMLLMEGAEGERRGDAAGTCLAGCMLGYSAISLLK